MVFCLFYSVRFIIMLIYFFCVLMGIFKFYFMLLIWCINGNDWIIMGVFIDNIWYYGKVWLVIKIGFC